jgi:class 3 adenylate cyclase
MSQSRQLAAIMFTDIVGYVALMGQDEQKAFELLKKNRSVQLQLLRNLMVDGLRRSVTGF